MPRKKIDMSSRQSKEVVKLNTNQSKKVSKPRTEAQQAAARKNLQKANAARKAYRELRKSGFSDIPGLVEAQKVISENLTGGLSFEANPAVQRLFSSIGEFKTESELENMTKQEYYRYTTAIREFLGSPMSRDDAMDYLRDRFGSDIIRSSIIQQEGEDRDVYLNRRKSFIQSNELSQKVFDLYRRIMETNAGQVIRTRMMPAAYGSDNLIVDLFDWVSSGAWTDEDVNTAVGYWEKQIDDEAAFMLERSREVGAREARKIEGRFDWRLSQSYFSYSKEQKRRRK